MRIKNICLVTLITILSIGQSCKTKQKAPSKKDYMEKFYTDLKTSIPEAEVQIIEDSIKVIFNGASFFDIGKTDLLPTTFPLFTRFSNVLNKYPNTHVLVLGHTDSGGDEDKNLSLSEKRAASAKNELIKNNVDPNRLSSWGMGETVPVYDNNTAEGRAKNRRIEFIILYGSATEE